MFPPDSYSLSMQRSLPISYDQSCGTIRTGENGVYQHSFMSDPIAGNVDVFDRRRVHCRPSRQTPIVCANKRIRNRQAWKKSLMHDLSSPPGLNEIHQLFEFKAVLVVLAGGGNPQIFGGVNQRRPFRSKV